MTTNYGYDALNRLTQTPYRRLIVAALLTQGITPEKIAVSLAFGIVLGVFPVLGSTTILCAAAALIFRLNLPSIQSVNWLIYPLQLICLVPFIHLGEVLFRTAALELSVAQIFGDGSCRPAERDRHVVAAGGARDPGLAVVRIACRYGNQALRK